MRQIADLGDLHGKRVLFRVDCNVPVEPDPPTRVVDDTWIRVEALQ